MTTMNATNPITPLPTLPETAPFTPAQRAWLNGFFAALVTPDTTPASSSSPHPAIPPSPQQAQTEDFPWHDPSLSIDQRLDLAMDKPIERKLMAAMAQLDCGSCGYLCQTYAEAISNGEEKNLTLCSPGGNQTAKKLKELIQLRVNKPGHSAGSEATKAPPRISDSHKEYDRNNPYPSRLLCVTPLNKSGSDKDTRHVVFDLKSSGLTYKPGDALGVYPENCPELVHEILELLHASGAEDVTTPAGESTSLYEALLRHCSITTPTDDLLQLLRHDPVEGYSILDLLKRHTGPTRLGDRFVAALAPLNPRLYSISSSPLAHVDQVHLTVGVVRYRNGAGTPCKGVCSTYLAERLRPGGKARVFFQPSHKFSLPDNGDTPIVMIGPGTGVAPLRAFLQHRRATGAKGRNWLFFGDQRRATDFLYEHELLAWHHEGLLTHLTTAFSRDQQSKIYVQHRMLEHQADLWRWLEQGAHVYVCGDAKKMAQDVDAALRDVVQRQGGKTSEQAIAYVAEMATSGRYQRDVY